MQKRRKLKRDMIDKEPDQGPILAVNFNKWCVFFPRKLYFIFQYNFPMHDLYDENTLGQMSPLGSFALIFGIYLGFVCWVGVS